MLLCAAICLGLSAQASAATPTYVQSPPLAQFITTQVGEVKQSGATNLRIITWGGDIATIFCNGNSKSTVKGSICDKEGLSLQLLREDYFPKQVQAYLAGTTPYLRGTMDQINSAVEVAARDPRTELKVIYQLTWSVGSDMLVVSENIKSLKDLCGKTIALQAYGPHVAFMSRVVTDACGSVKSVKIKWTKELTGKSGQTPSDALAFDKSVDAVFVIDADGLPLTSNGKVGTGTEGSVKGARVFLSTKSAASRVIADVYAVRADYLKANRDQVQKLVHALTLSQEALKTLVKTKARSPEYKQTFTAAAEILLDSKQAVADVESMYAGCEFVGFAGNVEFFTNPKNVRNFAQLTSETQTSLVGLGLMAKPSLLAPANWDYDALRSGVTNVVESQAKLDGNKIAQAVEAKRQSGTLESGIGFEVRFALNQREFSAAQFTEKFDEAIRLAKTYGGAALTVEGHADQTTYLERVAERVPEVVLRKMAQAAKNLSLSRANEVRDALIKYGRDKGVSLDPDQFAVIGHGYSQPKAGMCQDLPCKPKDEAARAAERRVQFRIVPMNAE